MQGARRHSEVAGSLPGRRAWRSVGLPAAVGRKRPPPPRPPGMRTVRGAPAKKGNPHGPTGERTRVSSPRGFRCSDPMAAEVAGGFLGDGGRAVPGTTKKGGSY